MKKFLNFQTFTYFLYVSIFILFFWVLSNSYLNGGYVIAGHDSGLPLNTGEFLKTRFSAWDERIGFGQDNSALFGSIILHSFDYIFSYLSGQFAAGNALAITSWLTLLFISAFIFAYSFKNVFGKYFVYIFPPLITVNFYIFQSMFILERAKYEIISALLLFMTLTFKVRNGQINILTAASLGSLIFFVFNGGGWIGLPLYGGVIIFALTFLVLEIILGLINFDAKNILRVGGFYFLFSLLFLILNSYSILPYLLTFISADSSLLSNPATMLANLEWIGSLSHGASFINLFRLQGVPDWFNSQYVYSPGHPFAQTYLENNFLIMLSFLIPIIALLSFIFAKSKSQMKELIFFWIITLIGMLFSAGTHPPLGFIYEFLHNNIPGFIIFRSPYYKFGSILFIGLTVIFAFSLSSLITKISLKFKIGKYRNFITLGLVVLAVSGWLIFYNKLYSVDIFSWQKGFSSRVKPPPYISEFSDFATGNIGDERILILPPLDKNWKNDGYDWGYWSLSTVFYSLSSKNFVVNGFGLGKEETNWINKIYVDFEEKKEKEFLDAAQRLNIKYILFRQDSTSLQKTSELSLEDYRKLVDEYKSIKKVKTFDKWELYEIDQVENKPFSLINSIALVPASNSYLSRDLLSQYRTVLYNNSVVIGSAPDTDTDKIIDSFARIKAYSVDCNTCFLEQFQVSNQLPQVTVLPDALLYKYKVYKENQEIEQSGDHGAQIGSYLAFILRRTAENFRMVTFGTPEKYLKSNTDTINIYLDRVFGLIQQNSDPKTDYITAIRVLSATGTVENNLRNYIQDEAFYARSEDMRNSLIDTMMKIYKIKDYYQSLLQDPALLKYEKRFLIQSFPVGGIVYLRSSTLPTDNENVPIFPKEVFIQQGDEITRLSVPTQSNQEWVELETPLVGEKPGFISLKFESFPNLFMPTGDAIKATPTGPKRCLSGKIKNFSSSKKYEVNISSNNKNQDIKLIFKSQEAVEGFHFLVGRPEVNIFPILSYQPFRYLYGPEENIINPDVYICSGDKELPDITKIEIFELSIPQLIVVKKEQPKEYKEPTINIIKHSPTKYIVNVENAKDPFILSLNQRFSPLWKLSEEESQASKIKTAFKNNMEEKHFTVDGYANGWVINKTGNYTLVVEYTPQILFLLGLKITLVALVLNFLYLSLVLYRLKKKKYA